MSNMLRLLVKLFTDDDVSCTALVQIDKATAQQLLGQSAAAQGLNLAYIPTSDGDVSYLFDVDGDTIIDDWWPQDTNLDNDNVQYATRGEQASHDFGENGWIVIPEDIDVHPSKYASLSIDGETLHVGANLQWIGNWGDRAIESAIVPVTVVYEWLKAQPQEEGAIVVKRSGNEERRYEFAKELIGRLPIDTFYETFIRSLASNLELVEDVEASGGLVIKRDGNYAPSVDQLWTDLGQTTKRAHEVLAFAGHDATLMIEDRRKRSKDGVVTLEKSDD